jgi:ubiquinone/menaquinone biosynthesis C-methylase UbiE
MTDFVDVSELAGDRVSAEQVERLCHRYYWAGEHCRGKDVLEVAVGSGAGLGYLAGIARTVQGGDCSDPILERVRRHYGDRIALRRFDAQEIPFPDRSFDVIILFEALYFVPSADRFAQECRRVLRPGGEVLVATANPDLYDFNPAPHSSRYLGASGLADLFGRHGFKVRVYGYMRADRASMRQRVLRPVKQAAVAMNLIPKTMAGKALLKRLVFGRMAEMPAEIAPGMAPFHPPAELPAGAPDRVHKVLYCRAILS